MMPMQLEISPDGFPGFRRSRRNASAHRQAVSEDALERTAAFGKSPRGSSSPTVQPPHACAAAQTDDEQARRVEFCRVVVPHLEEAYVLARSLTGNRTDAEDIVQDASLNAYRAIESYAQGDARSWVLTILRHSAYSWLRKNRRSALVPMQSLDDLEEKRTSDEAWTGQTPEAALIARADSRRVERTIGALPARFRDPLVLREIHGFDYREIAERLNIPMGTVMSRLARARRRLVEELSAGDPDVAS